jgi:hypothetical protein
MEREIKYFQENADGVIVDVSRNPGGYVCEAERLLRYFAPDGIRTAGNAVRVTWDFIQLLQEDIAFATELGATGEELAELEHALAASRAAYAKSRLTEPLPFCGNGLDLPPGVDRNGNRVVFTKPVMVVVDDRSASAAELFASVMQDNGRATVFGYRTSGAGGAVSSYPGGVYSETGVSLAWTVLIRKENIGGTEYPSAPYIENIGVRPNRTEDYMTEDNLLNKGSTYVKNMFDAMVEYINSKR